MQIYQNAIFNEILVARRSLLYFEIKTYSELLQKKDAKRKVYFS